MNIIKSLELIKENFIKLKDPQYVKKISDISILLCNCIKNNNKIIFCGNGGSAADSEHLSAELIGRYLKNRRAYPALSIVSNISAVTAIGNDYGFDNIFTRQVESIGRRGDVLFAMTTSGKSKNILKVIKFAKKKKIKTVLLTSDNFISKKKIADLILRVPSRKVDRIQEMHIAIGHMICEEIENNLR
jgi:D-sedoheptulose 7-phosphate isomerase